MNRIKSPYFYRQGLEEGIPIGLGYLSVSFGFGITASAKGIKLLEAVLISMTNLTSAGQIAGIGIIAAGGAVLEMCLAQLIISLRYALMGISLSQRMDSDCSILKRFFLAFCLTDEIFAVAVSKPEKVGPKYLMGLLTSPYLGWTLGTLLGMVAGQLLPESLRIATGMLIYAMFLAIMIPPMRTEIGILPAVLLAAGLSCAIYFIPAFSFITEGFSIIICAVIAALVISCFIPTPEEKEELKHEE